METIGKLESLINYMYETDCPARKRFNFDIIGETGRIGKGHINATVNYIRHLKTKAQEMKMMILVTSTEQTEKKDTIH